jgi:hypothetical protein
VGDPANALAGLKRKRGPGMPGHAHEGAERQAPEGTTWVG